MESIQVCERERQGCVKHFRERRESFARSLQNILEKVASDESVLLMLQNTASSRYITKRIEEIVTKTLFEDRETELLMIMEKYKVLKQQVATSDAQEFQVLGKKLIEISKRNNENARRARNEVEAYKQTVSSLKKEIVCLKAEKAEILMRSCQRTAVEAVKTDDIGYIPGLMSKVKLLSTETQSLRVIYEIMLSNQSEMLSSVKESIKSALISSKYLATDKLKRMKQRISVLEAENQKMSTEVLPQYVHISEEKSQKQEAYIADLQSSLNTSQIEILNTAKTMQDVVKTNALLRAEIEHKTTQIRQLQRDSDLLRETMNKVMNENVETKAMLKEKMSEILQKQSTINDLSSREEAALMQVNSLREQNSTYANEVASLTDDIMRLRGLLPEESMRSRENELLKEKIVQVTKEAERTAEKLQKNVKDLEAQLQESKMRVMRYERESKTHTESISWLHKTISERDTELKQNRLLIAALQEKVDSLELENRRSIASATRRIDELEHELREQQMHHENELAEEKNKQKHLKEQMEEVKTNKEALRTTFEDLRLENDKLLEDLSKSQAMNTKLEESLRDTKERLDILAAEMSEKDQRIMRLEQSSDLLRNENEQTRKSSKDAAIKSERMRITMEEKQNVLLHQLNKKSSMISKLESKIGMLEASLSDLKKKNWENEGTVESLKLDIEDTRQKNIQLTRENKVQQEFIKEICSSLGISNTGDIIVEISRLKGKIKSENSNSPP